MIILFEGGVDLSFESVHRSLKGTLLVTVVSYCIAFALLTIAAALLTPLPLQTVLSASDSLENRRSYLTALTRTPAANLARQLQP